MRTKSKRAISILLSVLMAVSGIIPAMSAFAASGDGVFDKIEMKLFYADTDTVVPEYQEDGKTTFIQYMKEGDELQLTYKLIDSVAPDNSYVKWHSENPVLVDVDQTGKIKAFDSSKGAVIQSWIDNEVKPIPIIGKPLGKVLEKAFFNDKIDLDSMDTEEIVDILVKALGSESWIANYIEAYKGKLIDSLRVYLDKVNTPIVCELYDPSVSDTKPVSTASVNVTVKKCEEWYATFLPNGTHITNKSQIATTQAVGSSVQIYAITTPQRLGFGTVYSVKTSSIFTNGKAVATVTDSGLVSFKSKGTATIIVSPDSKQVIESILKMVNYLYKLDNTGTLDTAKIADILIKYMGVDIDRNVLAALLDAAFAIYKIVGDTADPIQLTATAVQIIANIILQMAYNDKITFNVVEAKPLTDFNISGVTSVKEGSEIQLSIVDVKPDAGDTSDIVWSSSDPTVASVDPKTGVIRGLDAGDSVLSQSKEVKITAHSPSGNITKSVTVTVEKKNGKYVSGVDINGPNQVEINSESDYSCAVYPKRVAESSNLYVHWGIQTGTDDDGNPEYTWADSENEATDGIGKISSSGHYTAVGGGKSTIAVKAVTGYSLSTGNFYEISSRVATKEVSTGIPVEKIEIKCTGGTSNSDTAKNVNNITVNGTDYQYITIKKNIMEGYAGNGAKFSATVYPETATVKNVKWVVDNGYYSVDASEDNTVSVKQKAGHEIADTFNIYAVSNDGKIVSNTITVCITRNTAKSNAIVGDTIEVINGKTADVKHSLAFDGSLTDTAYACYKANWYSSDESIFSVKANTNANRDGIITGNDVGMAKVYCVSADGGIIATANVVVKPDKTYLKQIVDLCDNANVIQTEANKKLYKTYMRKLDMAYTVLYDQDMASQNTCETTARNLLSAFYKIGGFVGLNSVSIKKTDGADIENGFVSVKVGATANYTKSSYDLNYVVNPSSAMYNQVEWKSSSDSISVDKNGRCKPTSNDACSALITCTVTDYMGTKVSDSVYVAFARTQATGLTLDSTEIVGGKVGETQQIKATVLPKNAVNNSTASCQGLVWSTSDEKVATVDQSGVVTFVYGGDCEIICKTQDGGFEAVCKVNVVTNYDSLKLLIKSYNDLQLSETSYYPETWQYFTTTMAEANALVEANASSQKEVDAMQAKLENAYNSLEKYNYLQKIELYLDGEPTSEFYQYDLRILKEGLSYKNAVLDLDVRLYPNNASYKDVVWASSDSNVSVSSDGKCSPTVNKPCWSTITCTVTDHFGHSFTDSVYVSFSYYPVTGMKLSETNINGAVGSTYQLTCTVEPTGTSVGHLGAASIQDYYWESDDESVATIDKNGLVTFVSAGSTTVRAVSYDGGITGECKVSTDGDRSGLKEALEKYKDIDTTEYKKDYAETFTAAYASAQKALTDYSLKQEQINEAANTLVTAAEEMIAHPFVKVSGVDISYTSSKSDLLGNATQIASGTVGSSDALSINLSQKYSNYNNYNTVELNAAAAPLNSDSKRVEWSTDDSYEATIKTDGTKLTVTPKDKSKGAWAKLTVTVTDDYDRVTTRTIYVTMSDNVATGITLNATKLSLAASDSSYQLTATVGGNAEFKDVLWSSSDESVATVSSTGLVTPIDIGNAVITAKTFDGGYTATVDLTVIANFEPLAQKVDEYTKLIVKSTDNYVYTRESLTTLSTAVEQARKMVNDGTATQAEVDAMYETVVAAYNALVKYVATTGVQIGFEQTSGVTEENPGYFRYTGNLLRSKTIQLTATPLPTPTAVYKEILWKSSNDNVSVDEFGLVTCNSSSAQYADITCTVIDEFDNTYSTTVTVSFVVYGVTAVTFDTDKVYGAPQETRQITPNLNQKTTYVKTSIINKCTYSSDNEDIATVDENGVVTFKTQGTAIITVTAKDGGYSGTIKAITTWDTSALKAAITEGEKYTYTDYAYEQGMALKNSLEKAKAVYANPDATQEEINIACAALTTAIANLEGHEFVAAKPTFTVSGAELESNASYVIDENSQVTVETTINSDAMYKSAVWTVENANGATAEQSGNNLVITKTEKTGSLDATLTITDVYDRTTTYTYTIKVINAIVNITDFTFTVDGVENTANSYTSSGHGIGYISFKGIQLGYVIAPEDATDPVSVTWSSSNTRYITVDENGFVELTTAGKLMKTNTATISCSVKNTDGTIVTKSISITISR